MAATGCATARRSTCQTRGRDPVLALAAGGATAVAAGTASAADRPDEPVPPVHRAAGGDLAADGCAGVGRAGGVPFSLAVGLARGRLPDDPGADLVSGRQPRSDGRDGHGSARAPAWADGRPQSHVVGDLRRL